MYVVLLKPQNRRHEYGQIEANSSLQRTNGFTLPFDTHQIGAIGAALILSRYS